MNMYFYVCKKNTPITKSIQYMYMQNMEDISELLPATSASGSTSNSTASNFRAALAPVKTVS